MSNVHPCPGNCTTIALFTDIAVVSLIAFRNTCRIYELSINDIVPLNKGLLVVFVILLSLFLWRQML